MKLTFIIIPILFISGSIEGGEFAITTDVKDQIKPRISCGRNNLLSVWEDYRSAVSADIWAQFIDFSGNLIRNNFLICNNTYDQCAPVIAWGDSSYLVVWMNGIGSGQFRIYGQLIDTIGNKIGPEIHIATVANSVNPGISFGDSSWLVVWSDFRNGADLDIYGQIIDTGGNLIGSAVPICDTSGDQLSPATSYIKGKGWLVVWENGRKSSSDIWGQFISPAGLLKDTNFPIAQAINNQRYPAIASCDTGWTVVWSDNRSSSSYYTIYTQFIDTAGVLIGPNFAIAETLNYLYYPQVGWNGKYWVVGWAATNKIIVNWTQISNSTQDAWYPGLAIVGNNCITVWQDNRNGNWDIYANLFTPAGMEEKSKDTSQDAKIEIYPNPFTQNTVIRYLLNENRNDYTIDDLRLTIYDLSGRLVKTFFNSQHSTLNSQLSVEWDRTDSYGKKVLSGVYFCTIKLNSICATKELIIL